jgi:hypothetical protein
MKRVGAMIRVVPTHPFMSPFFIAAFDFSIWFAAVFFLPASVIFSK